MRIEHKIASILTKKKQTLATAESCSGGLLAHTLTNIPGSSAFFWLGITAYDNAAKTKILNIPVPLIKKHGAVSDEVARAMAQGIRKILKTDFGIGITGIAGPDGGTKTKPIGLVYVAVSDGTFTMVKECRFKGNRLQNKKNAVQASLELLLSTLEEFQPLDRSAFTDATNS